jgi:hypothetical protein
METPTEWAKKFNQPSTADVAEVPKVDSTRVASPAAASDFPDEPFLCPSCGQLLGPSVRTCVSCKHVINPAEIARTPAPALPTTPRPARIEAPRESVPYPWRILVAVMGIGMIVGLIAFALLGPQNGPKAIQAIPIVAGFWVFFDAFQRRIPRPFRWSMGTMLLLGLVLPWYLARRSKPQASVPFIESETRSTTRILLIILLVVFLIGVAINVWQGQQAASKPGSNQSTGANSRVALNVKPGADRAS